MDDPLDHPDVNPFAKSPPEIPCDVCGKGISRYVVPVTRGSSRFHPRCTYLQDAITCFDCGALFYPG